MADTSMSDAHVPLGVGTIISESFSIFSRNIIAVMILAFIPAVFGILVSGALNGWGFATNTPEAEFLAPNYAAIALDVIIQMVVYGLTTALLIQLAYDSKLQRTINIGSYFGPALSAALPIAVLGLVAGIIVGIGTIALVIPGLWLYAVFSMISPAVVIEKAGYRGMRRSANLTKEYRWPVLGALLIILICTIIVSFAVSFVVGMVGAIAGSGLLISILTTAIGSAIGTGLGGIAVSLIYARLREIKEGVSVDQIASVFD